MAWLFIDGKTVSANIGRVWEDKKSGRDFCYQYSKTSRRRRLLQYRGITDEYMSLGKWKRY